MRPPPVVQAELLASREIPPPACRPPRRPKLPVDEQRAVRLNPGMSLPNLSAAQLRTAAELTEKIEALQARLHKLLGGQSAEGLGLAPKKRNMSAAGRAAIRAAQKARWAKIKAATK
jgi:hypothetical protein